MRNIIRQIILEETNGNPLSKVEITLFKFINNKKKETKSKSELESLIKDTLKYMGLDPNLAKYYFNLYTLNYRENGDYENLTFDDFVGPKDFRQTRTTNATASDYTKAKMPFKGSNLHAEWKKDSNNVDYYAVYSWGWYPIYLFKQDVWYEIVDHYSSSTGRHLSTSNPIQYNSKIGRDIVLVTRREMESLERSATYEKIMSDKVKNAVQDKEKLISKKTKNVSSREYYYPEMNQNPNDIGFKVKFKISDVREENGKIVVDVNIIDVNRREDNRAIKTGENYTKGELPGVTKEKVEKNVIRAIQSDFVNYVGKHQPWAANIEDKSNIKYNFIHNLENK